MCEEQEAWQEAGGSRAEAVDAIVPHAAESAASACSARVQCIPGPSIPPLPGAAKSMIILTGIPGSTSKSVGRRVHPVAEHRLSRRSVSSEELGLNASPRSTTTPED